jgi:hypothetical protein
MGLSWLSFSKLNILTVVQALWKTFGQYKHALTNQSRNSTLRCIYKRHENLFPHKDGNMNAHSNFFKIDPNWKHLNNHQYVSELNRFQHICTMEWYSLRKGNKLLNHATTWNQLFHKYAELLRYFDTGLSYEVNICHRTWTTEHHFYLKEWLRYECDFSDLGIC